MSTRRGRNYQEEAAVAAAIAAVAAVNDAADNTNMMDSHAGDSFSGGVGGETDVLAVNDAINVAINDFVATIDIDHEGVNIEVGEGDRDSCDSGDGDIGDGGGGGDGLSRRKGKYLGKVRSCFRTLHYYNTTRQCLAQDWAVHAKAIVSASLRMPLFVPLLQVIWFGSRGEVSMSKIT